MVNCYHGTKHLLVQFSCSTQLELQFLWESKKMMSYINMEQEKDEMSWHKSDNLRMCSAMKGNQLWSKTFTYKELDHLPDFQDKSITSKLNIKIIEKFAADLMSKLITDALLVSCKITWSIPCSQICHMSDSLSLQENLGQWSGLRLCWTPELLQGSGNCKSSTDSSPPRHSSSRDALPMTKMDDSSFITSVASHDTLSSSHSPDAYNVPLDSDYYAIPINFKSENPRPPLRAKRRHTREGQLQSIDSLGKHPLKSAKGRKVSSHINGQSSGRTMGNSSRLSSTSEPIHLTLQEVRQCIHNLYASPGDSTENKNIHEAFSNLKNPLQSLHNNNNNNNICVSSNNNIKTSSNYKNNIIINNHFYNKNRKNTFSVVTKNKKAKENCESSNGSIKKLESLNKLSACRPCFSLNLKQTLCNIFRFKRLPSPDHCLGKTESEPQSDDVSVGFCVSDGPNPPCPITRPPLSKRALPPLPQFEEKLGDIIVTDSTPLPSPENVPPLPPRVKRDTEEQSAIDFASSIEKVKDYGWYWGPISGEAAEKILSDEPDGSFIVRDSSDNYYIFSLTFKLNSIIRHVRIEHDRGKFSFGSSHRFKSNTIVDFIESAVEHSRSGRYLFFLHRKPVLGPMRVQLLHPVSRFKQVQSLQHLCRSNTGNANIHIQVLIENVHTGFNVLYGGDFVDLKYVMDVANTGKAILTGIIIFVILKFVRKDLIRDLPLPRSVLDYLAKQHYYFEHVLEEEESDSSLQEELDQFLCFSSEEFS